MPTSSEIREALGQLGSGYSATDYTFFVGDAGIVHGLGDSNNVMIAPESHQASILRKRGDSLGDKVVASTDPSKSVQVIAYRLGGQQDG